RYSLRLPPFPTRRSSDLGEGDQVAARRPYRGGIAALALADPRLGAPVSVHDIELLRSAAVGFEHDALPVRRKARPGVDRRRIGQDRKSTRLNSSHVKISY